MVAPVITSIQDIEDSQGGSAVPRLGVTEEGMDDQERWGVGKVPAAVVVTVQADRTVRQEKEGSRAG